jgi:hypothetical protein
MSVDYAIVLPIADIPDPLPDSRIVKMADDGVDIAYLVTNEADPLPDWPVTAAIWGAWDNGQPTNDGQGYLQLGESYDVDGETVIGSPTHPINPDYWIWVNPLGNDNRVATGPLRTMRWQGHPEKKKAITDQDEYPVTDDPFILTITREDNVWDAWVSDEIYPLGEKVTHNGGGWQSQQSGNENHEPGQPGSGPWWAATEFGWGWIATMIEPAQSQDSITNYNIRVYPDPDCTPGTQNYTSGNFADVGGTFQTSATPNNWTPTEEQLNIALIFVGGGNTQNGIVTLEVGQNEVTREFWSHDQP